MQAPRIVKARNVGREEQVEHNGDWIPARPSYPFLDLSQRIHLAWGVFTGRYDALDWEYR